MQEGGKKGRKVLDFSAFLKVLTRPQGILKPKGTHKESPLSHKNKSALLVLCSFTGWKPPHRKWNPGRAVDLSSVIEAV